MTAKPEEPANAADYLEIVAQVIMAGIKVGLACLALRAFLR